MIPDKIYIDIIDMDSGYMMAPSFENNGGVEYIHKDAILEWIQEARAIPHENAIVRDLTFQEVINKINFM